MSGREINLPRFGALGRCLKSFPGDVIFWLILFLAIIDRVHLLVKFGFVFTDSDQLLLWMGGEDYSHGIFHEPCVYGQNYLFMLESLLAAPLLRLGVAAWHVFPLVTSALALAPYLAFAFYYRTRDPAAACVFASIPLLLPTEFGMMTTASHGTITGLCVASFFPVIYGLQNLRLRFLLAGFAAGLALLLNPNSLPVLTVLVLSMQLRSARAWQSWLYPVLGAVPFGVLSALVAVYYAKHPPMHTLAPGLLVFDSAIFLRGLNHLDTHFLWLCPVIWNHGAVALALLLMIMGVLLAKGRLAETLALLAGTAVILYALGFPKIEDGTSWAIFSYSRMYVAIPLLLGIAFSFCADLINPPRMFSFWLLIVSIVIFVVKGWNLDAAISAQENAPLELVKLRRIAEVKRDCGRIGALCKGRAGLVVALPPLNCTYADAAFYCYGQEMIFPDYPRTLIYGFERRSWRVEMEAANVTTNILFIGGSRQGWTVVGKSNIADCSDGQTVLHLVHNSNALPLANLLRELKPVMK